MRITYFLARFAFAAMLLTLLALQPAQAQFGPPGRIPSNAAPEQVLRELVVQLQTGTPDASFIGEQLWQLMAAQTNNTGVYPALVQLGRVQSVEVIARRDLPAGPVYSLKAMHVSGSSTWSLGVSKVTHKVEYANFGINAATAPVLPPQPDPHTTPSTSKACEMFPNMCPS